MRHEVSRACDVDISRVTKRNFQFKVIIIPASALSADAIFVRAIHFILDVHFLHILLNYF